MTHAAARAPDAELRQESSTGGPSGAGRRPADVAGPIVCALADWAGVLAYVAAGCFVSLAVVAGVLDPNPVSPWANSWVSDLGNRRLNPDGAVFYRAGCCLGGALLLAMCAGLRVWRARCPGVRLRLVTYGQLLGTLISVALVMTAVFPEDDGTLHLWWAVVLFLATAALLSISVFVVGRDGGSRTRLWATVGVGLTAITSFLCFSREHWIEWVVVADQLLFLALLGSRTAALSRTCTGTRGEYAGASSHPERA